MVQARVQAAKQNVEKVAKSTPKVMKGIPKAPRKRKLRDDPTHLRWQDEWSDTESSMPVRKKQKKQVCAPFQSFSITSAAL